MFLYTLTTSQCSAYFLPACIGTLGKHCKPCFAAINDRVIVWPSMHDIPRKVLRTGRAEGSVPYDGLTQSLMKLLMNLETRPDSCGFVSGRSF